MTDSSPEFRLQQIKTRRLEISATLLEWKRAYFVEGIKRTYAERLTLEAEEAQLALERRSIEDAAFKARVARQDSARQTLAYQLLVVLRERGLDDVIAEAQARADQEKPQGPDA